VAVIGHYLDGIGVVGVCGVGDEGCHKFAEVLVYMLAVGNACNIELYIVYTLKTLILWPDADVVAFILDAEVLKFLNGCIRITATNHYLYLWFFNRVTVVIEQVEVGRLFLLSRFILLFTGVVRLGQHVGFVGIFVGFDMSQPVNHQNDGYKEKK
jgi:hypothetical protein